MPPQQQPASTQYHLPKYPTTHHFKSILFSVGTVSRAFLHKQAKPVKIKELEGMPNNGKAGAKLSIVILYTERGDDW